LLDASDTTRNKDAYVLVGVTAIVIALVERTCCYQALIPLYNRKKLVKEFFLKASSLPQQKARDRTYGVCALP
jgi:hypothetical protein